MKENKWTHILTTLVCLIPVIAGLILLPQLPEEIVTHWDMNGVPNGWSPKITGAVVYPGILLVVNLVLPALMKVDPRYSNMNKKTLALIQWIIPIASVFCSGTTLANALGVAVDITILGPMFMGVLLMIIGNYLPKMTQSYTLGIKLPWTLDSEDNWEKTHRLSGVIWVIGGLLMIISAFFTRGRYMIPVILVAMIGIPVVYSYAYYRKSMK